MFRIGLVAMVVLMCCSGQVMAHGGGGGAGHGGKSSGQSGAKAKAPVLHTSKGARLKGLDIVTPERAGTLRSVEPAFRHQPYIDLNVLGGKEIKGAKASPRPLDQAAPTLRSQDAARNDANAHRIDRMERKAARPERHTGQQGIPRAEPSTGAPDFSRAGIWL